MRSPLLPTPEPNPVGPFKLENLVDVAPFDIIAPTLKINFRFYNFESEKKNFPTEDSLRSDQVLFKKLVEIVNLCTNAAAVQKLEVKIQFLFEQSKKNSTIKK